MNTNLKLLLDECVPDPLAELLANFSGALKFKSVKGLMDGADDVQVVAYAKSENLIVLTTESSMNHRNFKICTHPGIIVLCGRNRHEKAMAATFKKFMLSGHRTKCHHAVSFVSECKVRIISQGPEETIPF